MFAALEKRAGGLCIGIVLAIVILGKMFGGSLKGLIPTACCIASGVWLWMKEVVRSGREVEWHSEQTRGETVGLYHGIVNGLVLTLDRLRLIFSLNPWNG